MMPLILKIDRWLLNHIFDRKRIFTINSEDCIDEYGNSYGKRGDHFYIKILELRSRKIKYKEFLNQYYKKNQIKSLNQMLGKKIKHEFGKKYFLPWDHGRVRDLQKFKFTYKIGPTSENLYDTFLKRLFKVYRKISMFGFHPYLFNDYPRVIKVLTRNKIKYLVRDGNHRLASLSYLNYKKISVCYEADHWKPSNLILSLRSIFKKKVINFKHTREFRIEDAENWPHVKSGIIQKNDAIRLFKKLYF